MTIPEETRAKQKVERHIGLIGESLETLDDFAQMVLTTDPAFIQQAASQLQNLSARISSVIDGWKGPTAATAKTLETPKTPETVKK